MKLTKITKYIDIDYGHRVTNHCGKCRSVHGHRGRIEAVVVGKLCDIHGDSSEGMVLDFSFMKQAMMQYIDAPCDHAFILYEKDLLLVNAYLPKHEGSTEEESLDLWRKSGLHYNPGSIAAFDADMMVDASGTGISIDSPIAGKIYLVSFVPTAENLAQHWYELLGAVIEAKTEGRATLKQIIVHETPTSTACYPHSE